MPAADRTLPVAPPAWRAGFGRGMGRVLVPLAYRCVVRGRDRVPAEGPLVLVANHSGLLDGPLVMSVAPRPVTFLVKQELFHGMVGSVLRGVGQISIDRTTGDRRALDAARTVLARGGVVGVFPEGTRGRGAASTAEAGVAWLALNAPAPVIPVAMLGTRRTGDGVARVPGLGRCMAVEFGRPLVLDRAPGTSGRAALEAANEAIRVALAALVASAAARTGLALPTDDPLRSGAGSE